MNLVNLEWDSKFYGFPIARLDVRDEKDFNLAALIDQFADSEYKLVYLIDHSLKLDLKKVSDHEQHTIELVDKKVIYKKSLDSISYSDVMQDIRVERFMHSELEQLALASGIYSRFKLDKRFSQSKFEEMYLTWLQKSLTGEMANVVFGSYDSERITGFVTLKIKDRLGSIGLIAVNQSYRGKGIGTKLLKAAEIFAMENKTHEIHVATQMDNITACKFYELNGYTVHTIENIYHIWKKHDHIQ